MKVEEVVVPMVCVSVVLGATWGERKREKKEKARQEWE